MVMDCCFDGTGFVSIPAFCGGGFCGGDARDINNNEIVVGDATANALYNYRHAIAYDANNTILTDLGTLTGGTSSRANALNELGQIVGWSASSVGNRAFLYESGAMTDLNSLIDPTTGWVLNEASGIMNLAKLWVGDCITDKYALSLSHLFPKLPPTA